MWNCKVLVLSLAIISAFCKRVPFYRRDYTYLQNFEAFYKLHETADSWTEAFDTCEAESSQLFYPASTEEASVLQILVAATGKNVTDIVLGLRDDFHLGEFITIHGKTTPFPLFDARGEPPTGLESQCVFLDLNNNYSKSDCIQRLSFICKKVEEVLPCPTIDKNYVYQSSTGKCYKVNNHKQTWQEAMSTCYNEGALLVILDNSEEAEAVGRMLHDDVLYHAGVHRIMRGDDLFTVKGTRIIFDNNMWTYMAGDRDEGCGVLLRCRQYEFRGRALYKTGDCTALLQFVCEMDTKL